MTNHYTMKSLNQYLYLAFALFLSPGLLKGADNFYGMWSLDIEGGGVGWIKIHDEAGFLDAELLWQGGSVLPVASIYYEDRNNLVVTRTKAVSKTGNKEAGRKHLLTYTFKMRTEGPEMRGTAYFPASDGKTMKTLRFTGTKLPALPVAPDLSSLKFGKPITLFNGSDLTGWKIINPEHQNGFKVVDGNLVNDPVQTKKGDHTHYGNLRTEKEFKDFNLKLEVNVPKGNNSGIYLRGLYEVQVLDSYGKDLDSHHMGAVYSRITPSIAAEKPDGEWQALDITLCKRHVTVKLNGTTIIDNQPVYGPTGGAILSDVFAPGPIFLQGDHGKVSYRNIVLTPIEE